MTILEEIARWCSQASLPQEGIARERSRNAIIDTLACMFAGADDPVTQCARAAARHWGRGQASALRLTEGLPAASAAFVNGTAAHALDYDDIFPPSNNHASAVLVPALLALGEEQQSSGRDVIDAYIVGLQAMSLIGRGVMRSHYEIGWHTTATIGLIGTAAACARLLKLSPEQTGHAISIGVTMASGPKVQFGTMVKAAHAGLAAQQAVQAAQMAQAGMAGSAHALDGKFGLLWLQGGEQAAGWERDRGRVESMPLAIATGGLLTKRFPCCGSSHRILDLLIEVMAERHLAVEDINNIETHIGHGNALNLMYDQPKTGMEARFSMPYAVALALRHGRPRIQDFTDDAVLRSDIRALFPLVTVIPHPPQKGETEPALLPHRLVIRMRGGVVYERARLHPVGNILEPLSSQDLQTKFDDCCRAVLSEEQAEQLLRRCLACDAEQPIRLLTEHLPLAHTFSERL
ncbi:MmgE/PrpD family protein [Alcaligenaceae bacterium]|nr:MmgE/PrpD family protein [Alcaligenaceae bacterium]